MQLDVLVFGLLRKLKPNGASEEGAERVAEVVRSRKRPINPTQRFRNPHIHTSRSATLNNSRPAQPPFHCNPPQRLKYLAPEHDLLQTGWWLDLAVVEEPDESCRVESDFGEVQLWECMGETREQDGGKRVRRVATR